MENEFQKAVEIPKNNLESILAKFGIEAITKELDVLTCRRGDNVITTKSIRSAYDNSIEVRVSINNKIITTYEALSSLQYTGHPERKKIIENLQSKLTNLMEVLDIEVKNLDGIYVVSLLHEL